MQRLLHGTQFTRPPPNGSDPYKKGLEDWRGLKEVPPAKKIPDDGSDHSQKSQDEETDSPKEVLPGKMGSDRSDPSQKGQDEEAAPRLLIIHPESDQEEGVIPTH
jgi:hypothetical protein